MTTTLTSPSISNFILKIQRIKRRRGKGVRREGGRRRGGEGGRRREGEGGGRDEREGEGGGRTKDTPLTSSSISSRSQQKTLPGYSSTFQITCTDLLNNKIKIKI